MLKTRKGNMNVLQAVAFGIVTLAIIVGIGLVVLTNLGNATAICETDYTYSSTLQKCVNATGGDATDPANAAWTGINYSMTQLGSTGLLSWLPAIIALTIGVFFLFYFMGGRKKY